MDKHQHGNQLSGWRWKVYSTLDWQLEWTCWPVKAHWCLSYELFNLKCVWAEVGSPVCSASSAIYQPQLDLYLALVCISYLDRVILWLTGLHLLFTLIYSYISRMKINDKFPFVLTKTLIITQVISSGGFMTFKKFAAPCSVHLSRGSILDPSSINTHGILFYLCAVYDLLYKKYFNYSWATLQWLEANCSTVIDANVPSRVLCQPVECSAALHLSFGD